MIINTWGTISDLIVTHLGPLRREGDTLNAVKDKYVTLISQELQLAYQSARYGEKIAFYHDVAEILHRLRAGGVIIAACSRTHTPAL